MEIYLFAVVFFGFTMYAANQVQIGVWQAPVIRILWYTAVALIFMLALFPLEIIMLSANSDQLSPEILAQIPEIPTGMALASLAFAALMGVISLLISNSVRFRMGVMRFTGISSRYDPNSVVHTTAMILMAVVVTAVVILFVSSGGISGLAASVEATGVDLNDTLFTGVLELLAAALGVGFALRRNGQQTLTRLGLVIPTMGDVLRGIGVGLVALFAINILLTLWQAVVAPEQFAEQTQAADQIAQAINTVWLALIVALTAAIGEEIFIRGALQPVFGIGLSSLFFALLHPQYFFSPPLVMIFGISVTFGILRQRYNTTTAIIAHFVYDFAPLLFILISGGITPT